MAQQEELGYRVELVPLAWPDRLVGEGNEPDLPDPRGDLGGGISNSHRDERGENRWLVGRRDGLSGGVLGLDRVRSMAQPLVSSICAQ